MSSLQQAYNEFTQTKDNEREEMEDDKKSRENDNEEQEQEMDISEEQFAKEIAEAFDNIRRLGRINGQHIARHVRDTFLEINGREPELREIADVFTRIKDKLSEEAKDESGFIRSSENIVIQNDVPSVDYFGKKEDDQSTKKTIESDEQTIIKKFEKLNLEVNNASKEEKEQLLKFARTIVKEDLQNQATAQLSKLIGRDPTKQELNDMLIQLATTSVLDCNYDSSDDTSDYNPDTKEEKLLFENDAKETVTFDEEYAKTTRQEEEEEEEEDESEENEQPTLINKPVLTTPVKNKGKSTRVDYYFEKYSDDSSELLLNGAINSFKKLHSRVPSNEEVENMKHFLHTEKANLLNETNNNNNEDKENTSYKLNFGVEDTVDID